jgi:21S rRNA (GM2251-2'-O)-methyltransferase
VLLECGDVTLMNAEEELQRIKQLWVGSAAGSAGGGQTPPVLVALDQVTDPNNLGAIARSITFFGLQGLILSSKNCARPSPSASKASAGTLETLAASSRLLETSQLHTCLSDAAKDGWCVLGAHASPFSPKPLEPQPLELTAGSITSPTILVLGSEGVGLRLLIRSRCTNTVAISGPSDAAGLCDSLNVASAAAVLLSRLCDARN